jgi:hypothetical protein
MTVSVVSMTIVPISLTPTKPMRMKTVSVTPVTIVLRWSTEVRKTRTSMVWATPVTGISAYLMGTLRSVMASTMIVTTWLTRYLTAHRLSSPPPVQQVYPDNVARVISIAPLLAEWSAERT